MLNGTGIYFATETNLFKREAEGRTKDNPKEAQPANTETDGVRELEWPFSKWYTALSGKAGPCTMVPGQAASKLHRRASRPRRRE